MVHTVHPSEVPWFKKMFPMMHYFAQSKALVVYIFRKTGSEKGHISPSHQAKIREISNRDIIKPHIVVLNCFNIH